MQDTLRLAVTGRMRLITAVVIKGRDEDGDRTYMNEHGEWSVPTEIKVQQSI